MFWESSTIIFKKNPQNSVGNYFGPNSTPEQAKAKLYSQTPKPYTLTTRATSARNRITARLTPDPMKKPSETRQSHVNAYRILFRPNSENLFTISADSTPTRSKKNSPLPKPAIANAEAPRPEEALHLL